MVKLEKTPFMVSFNGMDLSQLYGCVKIIFTVTYLQKERIVLESIKAIKRVQKKLVGLIFVSNTNTLA